MKIKPLSLHKDKRGMGIGDMYPVILTIAIVAILIAVVLIVLDDFGTNVAESSPTAGSQVNETHSFGTTVTQIELSAETTNCSAHDFAISNIYNGSIGSSAYVIDSGNYTLDTATGVVKNSTGIFPRDWLISYTWNYGGASCVATRDIIDDIADFIPWIGVILLIVAAAIVLGILIRNLAGGSRV